MDGISAASAIASLVILGGKVSMEAHGFFGRMKDCPKRMRNVGDDLEGIISILEKLEKALQAPANAGVFSLQGKEEQFTSSMQGLGEVFEELSDHMKKYEHEGKKKWSLSYVRKSSRWAATGMEEAVQLSRSLSNHKDNLNLTLQLTQCETLAALEHRSLDIEDALRIMMSVLNVQASSKGINDPRLHGWLESVADYTGSIAPEDATTILQDYSPMSSTTSLDVIVVAESRAKTDKEELEALREKMRNLELRTKQLQRRIGDQTLPQDGTDVGSECLNNPQPPEVDLETEKRLQAQQEVLDKERRDLGMMKAKEAAKREQLLEVLDFLNESRAREQKMNDDAEHAAEMAKRIAEGIAEAKAEMDAAQKTKEIAEAEAKYHAGIAEAKAGMDAAQKAKEIAEKEVKYRAESAALAAAEARAFKEPTEAAYEMAVKTTRDAYTKNANVLSQPRGRLSELKPVAEVRFTDVLGRKFRLPFVLCKTWEGVTDLVKHIFKEVDLPVAGAVQDGKYDLVGPSGVILPQKWESVIDPQWSITMQMWPMHTWDGDDVDDVDDADEIIAGVSSSGWRERLGSPGTDYMNRDEANPFSGRIPTAPSKDHRYITIITKGGQKFSTIVDDDYLAAM